MKSKYNYENIHFIQYYSYRLGKLQQQRSLSGLGSRSARSTPNNSISRLTSPNSNLNNTNTPAEATLLDENGLPLVGHLLAFTPDVIEVFQDAAKLIDESHEIKKQAMRQIRDAFKDAKAYSLTVNQSVAQKLADIITLAVRKMKLILGCFLMHLYILIF
jgi:hypothetical protein